MENTGVNAEFSKAVLVGIAAGAKGAAKAGEMAAGTAAGAKCAAKTGEIVAGAMKLDDNAAGATFVDGMAADEMKVTEEGMVTIRVDE